MGRRALSSLLFLLVAACVSSPAPRQKPDGGTPCYNGGTPCPAGSSCVNGLCTATCAPGTACAAPQFCEGAQAPELVCAGEPAGCVTGLDCPAPQDCYYGLCLSLQPLVDGGVRPCDLGRTAADGCGPDALCYRNVDSSGLILHTCIGMPPCGASGSCPSGSVGSVCNDFADGGQIVPGKQRFCLFSYCLHDSDCAALAHCFRASPTQQPGECYLGFAGDPCLTGSDCAQATLCAPPDGGFTDGGAPGVCQ